MPVALLAALALTAAQPGSAAAFDLPAYAVELERSMAAIAASGTRDDGVAAAAAIPDTWHVSIDGRVVVVDARWIDTQARGASSAGWQDARAAIGRRLAAMRGEAAGEQVPFGRAPESALSEVLARKEFQRTASAVWLDALRARVGDWIRRVIRRVAGSRLVGRGAAIAFAWTVSLLALIVLTAWLLRTLTRRTRAAVLALGPVRLPREPAREWARRAAAAARAGDLRESIRCAYRAALCRLEEQGTWQVDESRTPREYVRLLKSDDPRLAVLSDFTRQFEQTWYGRRAATDDDARRLFAHLERLGCLRAAERPI